MFKSSVVNIPTYNRPDDLNLALLSILEQSQKQTEVVIIDDGNLGTMPLKNRFEELGIQCMYPKK